MQLSVYQYKIYTKSSAQPSNAHIVDEITAVDLRAPNSVLGGPWDEKVDSDAWYVPHFRSFPI